MKIKKILYFWAFASLLLMVMIFWFSSRTAEESGEMSGSLTRGLFEAMWDWDEADGITQFMDIINMLEVIVRKSAHFLIFFALGFCAANTVRYIIVDTKRVFLISLIWCSFYAATDEWHQYFVPGRACMWQDWVIDTAGVLCGIGAAIFIIWIIESLNRRKLKRKAGGVLEC